MPSHRFGHWVVLFAVLWIGGCGDDEPGPVVPVDKSGTELLNYDANNETAPFLPARYYEGAAYFPSERVAELAGGSLVCVQFFLTGLPAECSVRVYDAGMGETPGDILYEADVASSMEEGWNTHTLATPLPLSGSVWISVTFRNGTAQRTLGCDPGPHTTNGDWFYDSTESAWYEAHTRGVDINWNVRGVVGTPDS